MVAGEGVVVGVVEEAAGGEEGVDVDVVLLLRRGKV